MSVQPDEPRYERWLRTPLAQLTLVRVREFFREPEAVFWALVFPLLLAAGLGVAFRNRPPEVLKIATSSPALVAALRAEPLLDVAMLEPAAGARALQVGRVALLAEQQADQSVVYRYDDTNPEARLARLLADGAVQRARGRVDPVASSERYTRDPGSRYIDFLIPGLVGMGIMGNAMWGLGFSVVDARRKKLMKRLVATPMPRHDYLLSFLCFRLLFLVVEVGVPIGFGHMAFGVPVRGSLLLILGLAVLGTLAFSALGLLLAARPRTIEAVSGLMNVTMLPMWIVSGVFFSAQRFPAAVQPVIKALPLTALVDAFRATMLQGAGLSGVAREAATLAAWTVVCFTASLKLFRWR
jgi:ABC-2 type transport system permease protein